MAFNRDDKVCAPVHSKSLLEEQTDEVQDLATHSSKALKKLRDKERNRKRTVKQTFEDINEDEELTSSAEQSTKIESSIHYPNYLSLCCVTCTRVVLIAIKGKSSLSTLYLSDCNSKSVLAITKCKTCIIHADNLDWDELSMYFSELHMSPSFFENCRPMQLVNIATGSITELLKTSLGLKYLCIGKIIENTDQSCAMYELNTECKSDRYTDIVLPYLIGGFM